MESTTSEGAKENMAFEEEDDECVPAKKAETAQGAQPFDETQTGVYIVPLSRNLPREEIPQLAKDVYATGELKGDDSSPWQNDETNNKQNIASVTMDEKEGNKKEGNKKEGNKKEGDKKEGDKKEGDKKERDKKEGDKKEGDKMEGDKKEGTGGTISSRKVDNECQSVQDASAPVCDTNKKRIKRTLLHFSNEGFESDSPPQQELAEIEGLVVKGGGRERRKKVMYKLKKKCIQIHFKCIGIALVCLIILSLFVLPPSTTW